MHNKTKYFFTLLVLLSLFLIGYLIYEKKAYTDPLPSWNEGKTKERLLTFITEAVQLDHKNFIPQRDRIATFDQDGTLWVEQPLYAEVFYEIATLKSLEKEHPEYLQTEPFKTMISEDIAKIKNFTFEEIKEVFFATHANMPLERFQEYVRNWLVTAKHPRYDRPFTDLIYQPMKEVIELLMKNNFTVYISSGGGQEFIRIYSNEAYNIDVNYVIGSMGKISYKNNEKTPELFSLPEILLINNKSGKPEGINLVIGKKPVIAFGNSIGDREMLEWSQSEERYNTLQLLVHHDDAQREYAYDAKSKIGTFTPELMEEAEEKNWKVISMKNDWKVIFPWE